MATFLFVHGTGVRKDAYNELIWTIERRLKPHTFLPCCWGDACGATLNAGGASVPGFNAPPPHPDPDNWAQLYQDPFAHLRLIAQTPAAPAIPDPFAPPPGDQIWDRIQSLQPPPAFQQILQSRALEARWQATLARLKSDTEFAKLIRSISHLPPLVSRDVARTLVASLIVDAMAAGAPALSGATRDALVDALVDPLGGAAAGIFDWPISLAARALRNPITDVFVAFAADVMLYQSRGQAIRDFILDKIDQAPGPVVLLAHSLGGIACVDVLAANDRKNKITHFITAGSQAPFLYEINALTSLPYLKNLPAGFPNRWLNIFDQSDLLSYKAAPVFHDPRIEDFENVSRQPPLAAHSAYWDSDPVIDRIRAFIATP